MEKTTKGLFILFGVIDSIFNKICDYLLKEQSTIYAFSSPPPFAEGCEGKKCQCYWLCKAGHRLSLSCEIMKTKDGITKKDPLKNQKKLAGKPQIRKEDWKKNGNSKFFSEKCAEEKICPAFSLCQGGHWIGNCDKMRQRFKVNTKPTTEEIKNQSTEHKTLPTLIKGRVATLTKTTATTTAITPAAERLSQIKKKTHKKIWPWSKKDVNKTIKNLMHDTKISEPPKKLQQDIKKN